MNPAIKLIAVDLDGTLLNSEQQLLPRTELRLRQALAAGRHVVLATGKTRYSSFDLVRRLGLKTPGVFSQGLIIADPDGTIRHQVTLPEELTAEIANLAVENDLTFVVYRDMEILCLKGNAYTDILLKYQEPRPRPVGSLPALLQEAPFQKFIFLDEPDRLKAAAPAFRERFAGRLNITFSQRNMLEFLPFGTSKGAGLQLVLEDLAVSPEMVIAFGDAENDLEMLHLAGLGIAMGNAMPSVKAAADHVTASNDDEGVAAALEKFLFD